MKKLSLRDRFALELREFAQLSFHRIGEHMQISEVTARTTYFKAKLRLNISRKTSSARTALR